jgi:hypothetical protein
MLFQEGKKAFEDEEEGEEEGEPVKPKAKPKEQPRNKGKFAAQDADDEEVLAGVVALGRDELAAKDLRVEVGQSAPVGGHDADVAKPGVGDDRVGAHLGSLAIRAGTLRRQ